MVKKDERVEPISVADRMGIVTILTTNTCTAECAHCCMNSNKTRRGAISAEEGKRTISAAHESGALLIVFAGGEPTLLKKDLFAMIRHASELGLRTRVVSNASWAITPAKARAMIDRFVEAGLTDLNVSYDDYHLPYIQHKQIKNAFDASRGSGLGAFIFAMCEAKDTIVNPDYLEGIIGVKLPLIRDHRYATDESCVEIEGTKYGVSNSVLMKIGEAREQLAPESFHSHSPNHDMWNSPCLAAMRDIAITPDNTVVPCCGAEFNKNEFMDLGTAEGLEASYPVLVKSDLMRLINLAGPNFVQRVVDRVSGQRMAATESDRKSICEICENLVKNPSNAPVLRRLIDDGTLGKVADDFEHRYAEARRVAESA